MTFVKVEDVEEMKKKKEEVPGREEAETWMLKGVGMIFILDQGEEMDPRTTTMMISQGGMSMNSRHLSQAIESGLPYEDVKTMCMKYADLEKSFGRIDRARAICIFSSDSVVPRSDNDFCSRWHDFEVQHENEDTSRNASNKEEFFC